MNNVKSDGSELKICITIIKSIVLPMSAFLSLLIQLREFGISCWFISYIPGVCSKLSWKSVFNKLGKIRNIEKH